MMVKAFVDQRFLFNLFLCPNRYAQFFSAQQAHSGLVQGSGQPSMKECQSAQGKSASVESLLSQTEHTDLFRNRSRSIPYAFQVKLKISLDQHLL